IYAEIVGYSSTMNAYRITDAPPDGGGAVTAMGNALRESGLGTDEVDYVAAHGTGTPGNDFSETTAIKKVFGDDAYKLTVSSAKSMTGPMTAAADARQDHECRARSVGVGDPQRPEHARDLRQSLPALPRAAGRAHPRQHGRARRPPPRRGNGDELAARRCRSGRVPPLRAAGRPD